MRAYPVRSVSTAQIQTTAVTCLRRQAASNIPQHNPYKTASIPQDSENSEKARIPAAMPVAAHSSP